MPKFEKRTKQKGFGKSSSAGKRNGSGHLEESLVREFIEEVCTEEGAQRVWGNEERRGEKQLVYFGSEIYLEPCKILLIGMRVLRPGLHLGTVKKDRFEPSHALALFLRGEDVKMAYDLGGTSSALAGYLRGESIVLSEDDPLKAKKGWILIMADGHSIGWAKAAGGMLKNHYPKGLRRMK